LVGLSPLPQLLAATTTAGGNGSATLNPVQLSIQTTNLTSVSSYDLVAYNSTGVPVASYTGQYSRVTFELPLGTYLFAATANGPATSQPPICCVCAQSGVTVPPAQPAKPTNSTSAATATSEIALPCYLSNPAVEYGYSLTQVSGSTTLTIATQSPSAIPTTDVSVAVSYENGTAVSNADVSASVVGAGFYWGDDSNLTMYAQTAANGVAQLVVPAVPLVVTASESVQVNLTQGQTTVQVNVGGQPVNVTLYYSPNYVYLSASALLVPPQTSMSMVLTAQSQSPVIPYAEGSASSGATADAAQAPGVTQGVAAGAPSNGSSTTTTTQMTTIPPIPASDLVTQTSARPSSDLSGFNLLAIGTLALAGAIAAIVGVAISKTKR
jgi:hypothetical protein